MKFRIAIAAISFAGVALCPGQDLFNGKDLTDWSGNPDFWSVQDGVIVGQTTAENKAPHNTFLIWQGGYVENFELTLKARVIGNNNSGIQYRSKVLDDKKWIVGGYQMDMHPSPNYFGMMYEEKGRGIIAQRGQKVVVDETGKKQVVAETNATAKLNLADWNTFSVTALGNKLTHKVNGVVTVEIVDNQEAKRSMKGVLALQLHAGGPMRFEAKDIVLKKLEAPSGKTEGASKQKAKAKVNASNTATGTANPSAKSSLVPQWIWTEKPGTETIYARRQWTQRSPMKSAKLTITADNSFTAYVNGKKVGHGSEWSNKYKFDILKHLSNGDNVLAVEAGNEGSSAGLAARVELVAGDGRKGYIVTDGGWLLSKSKRPGWMAPSVNTVGWVKPVVIGPMGIQPWGDTFSKQRSKAVAAPAPKRGANVHPEGFEIERIYDVPKGEQGSWVSMAVDDKGRLYCSDQGGKGIFRVTLGGADGPVVEKVPADVSSAHGLLWAFDSLYVCGNGGKPGSGLHRVTDSNGDDKLDKIESFRRFEGGGEHGPHAVVLSPDGKSLFVLGGNHTKPPKPETSVVVPNYAEDQLLPRMPDARGHAANIRAPGGWIARTDPDGKSFEFYSCGFRNQYDVAFNSDGEMFTFDSDMEWDSGTPWYRPTRFYHVTSGSEFGWRTGTGKFPTWYPDTLPPTLDIGPGSPTGVVSGLGSKFPAKYQNAIYIFDWTYGTIYAMHLVPDGSSYQAVKEEFVTGIPLNVSDGVIGTDGNFYFAIGGRGTPSALFKVSYTGSESTQPARYGNKLASSMRHLRRKIEEFQGKAVPGAVDKIWKNLGHEDRFIRFAARVALEHQPVSDWAEKALKESDLQTSLSALLALTRQGDKSLQIPLLEALGKFSSTDMSEAQQLEALRLLSLAFIRMGKPDAATAEEILQKIEPLFPARSDALNRELIALLVYLESPGVVAKAVPLLSQEATGKEEIEFDDNLLKRSGQYGGSFLSQKASNPQRQQIHYAYALKNVGVGWSPNLRRQFFEWYAKSKNFKGGASFGGFIENFRKESLAKIPDEAERKAMDELSRAAKPLVPEGFADVPKLQIGTKAGMLFDKTSLEAKAGTKIAIVLTNTDPTGLMHNLAVVKPGTREKVVAAALTIGPKAIEQNFVPDIPEVLAATPQVAPGRRFTLYFEVPSEPGDYPYVCTYPGHGQLMHGILKVIP